MRILVTLLRLWTYIPPNHSAILLNLMMRRSLTLKHDFAIHLSKVHEQIVEIDIVFCHWAYLMIVYHKTTIRIIRAFMVQVFKAFKSKLFQLCLINVFFALVILKRINQSIVYNLVSEPNIPEESSIVGGGPPPILSYDELAPYYVNKPWKGSSFKCLKYVEKSEGLQSLVEESYFACDLPFDILKVKINIPTLKVISNAHKLTVHSKLKRQEIQNIISAHACHTCNEYLTIVQSIDEGSL